MKSRIIWCLCIFTAIFANSLVIAADEAFVTTPLTRTEKDVMKALGEHITYNDEGQNTVGRIVIDDMKAGINQSTWIYVRTALDYYKEVKPAFIILELNTPGGEVFAAQKISDALKDFDTQYDIPIVAFVNNWAISAGAMLAYSCRFVVIAKDAAMGAAEPVFAGGEGGMTSAPEKVNSALRADFANRARFFGRNALIAEAMVDKDAIVVIRDGIIIKLDTVEQMRTTGKKRDEIISAEGKLLTLDATELMGYGVADMMVMPQKREPITPQEKDDGKWHKDKSPIFTHPYFSNTPENLVVNTYEMDWKGKFFALLASPIVSSLLFLGLMLGFYTEFRTPGFGFPGLAAITCLFFIALSSYSLEATNWLEIIFLITGAVFIALEIFVIPGFGFAGIIGILLCTAGLLSLMLPGLRSITFDFDSQTLNAAGQAVLQRFVWLCGTFVVGCVAIATLSKYVMPKFKVLNRLVLQGEETHEEGFVAGLTPEELPPVGAIGIVAATLRPAGKITVEGEIYDAMGQGDFIKKGTSVIVTAIEGSRLIVQEKKE
ncbi:MAG: hypothetical protein HN831_02785 [Waddliaceae bacterium]|nr:hypothetical protein [Waddliaceae bacterium]MBT7264387.1 hypothetical protein [Waddliaceae bacterium]